MSRIKVTRGRKQKRDKTAIARGGMAWMRREEEEHSFSTGRVLWGLLVGASSLALGLYHPAMAQDELGRDRQPVPREPEGGFRPWNTFPAVKPELNPLDHPLWPEERRYHTRGAVGLMAQQEMDGPPKQHFEIPAGALGPALTAFSRQTDLQLLYLSELIEGRTTQGVQGDYTPEDGLKALLSGTGLQYQFSDLKTVVLQPAGSVSPEQSPTSLADQPKPIKVPEVVVKDTKQRMLVVDSPDGYKADVSSEAVLRFPASIQELPMSVSVVTKDSIRERRAVTQQQVLEGIAGIGKAPVGGAARTEDYIIRGFQADPRANIGTSRDNGLTAFNNYVADPTLYERIEVIKGSASFTSGLVSSGGFVNRLLKAPERDNFVVSEFGGGSAGHYRTTVDANGVMPNLPVAGRLVFTQNEDPEFFRNTGSQRFSFLPSVRFATENDFTLTVTGNVQRLRGKGNFGSPTTTQGLIPGRIEDSFLGNDNRLKVDYHSVHAEAEKKFVQGLRLKVKGQYSKDESSYRYGFGYQYTGIGPDGNVSLFAFGRDWKRESFAGEVNLTKEFSFFGNLSSVAAGMDYSVGRVNTKGTSFLPLGTGNISSPQNNFPFPPGFTDPAPNFIQDFRFNQTGAFAQVLLRPFTGTTVMAALRGNWITQQAESPFITTGQGDRRGVNESKLTPQVGLSQRLIEGLNVYASYGESIQPNFNLTADGTLLRPMTGKTIEIGSKWELLAQRLRLTAALFRTDLDNVSTPDPNNILFSVGGQSQRNQGFEFEARGAPLPHLQVNLAYTLLDTEITKSLVPNVVGARAFNAPTHTVSVFGSYDFSELLTKGLKLGAVVYYRSEVSSFPGTQNQTYEGYTRADLFAVYAPLTWLSVQVNLNNIADARYVEGPFNYSAFNQFGAPRHVIGMVRMMF